MKFATPMFAASLALLPVPVRALEIARVTDAQFRGCEAAGWCSFHIESARETLGIVIRVRPDGVGVPANDLARVAMRNRLNALLVDMIHQYKAIELRNVRSLGDDTHAAQVIVNDADVAADPVLMELAGAEK